MTNEELAIRAKNALKEGLTILVFDLNLTTDELTSFLEELFLQIAQEHHFSEKELERLKEVIN